MGEGEIFLTEKFEILNIEENEGYKKFPPEHLSHNCCRHNPQNICSLKLSNPKYLLIILVVFKHISTDCLILLPPGGTAQFLSSLIWARFSNLCLTNGV